MYNIQCTCNYVPIYLITTSVCNTCMYIGHQKKYKNKINLIKESSTINQYIYKINKYINKYDKYILFM